MAKNQNTHVKPPVILQVLPELRSGGVERGTVEIAHAIVKAGGKSMIASQGGSMAEGLDYAGTKHFTLKLASKNPLTIWLNSFRLARIIRKHHVDIVHARSRAPGVERLACMQADRLPFCDDVSWNVRS